jgi:DNA-binding MarR family transcriptional regulator
MASRNPPRGDFIAVEGHLFYWLTKAMNHRNAALAKALAPLSCSVPQWRVMNMLRQDPHSSIAELADKTAIERSTLTRTIDGLEADGLVIRRVRPDNRRIVDLELTRRGHAFYEKVPPSCAGRTRAPCRASRPATRTRPSSC